MSNTETIVTDVNSVEDFLKRYYKSDRYTGRGKEYAKALLESNQKDFDDLGYACISKHDSVTGTYVRYDKN